MTYFVKNMILKVLFGRVVIILLIEMLIYEHLIRNLSFGESVIISIHSDSRCSWTIKSVFNYFNPAIGDYIEYNPAKIVIV